MSNRVKYQGGSVIGFAVVGVLLAVLLVGGLYWLQRYSDDIEQRGQEIASENRDDAKEPGATSSPDDSNDSTEAKDEENKQSEPADSANKSEKSDNTAAKDDSTEETLPETGPAETLVQFVGFSILTFAVVSYVRSRHPL